MESFTLVMMFLFGSIIGSFLNVVIYRMHTGRSLDGRSHCMTCGHTLVWYELVPVLSYLLQRARCRHCGAFIPTRYLTVELLTGGVYVLLLSIFAGDLILLSLNLILASLLIVIAVYDMRHTVIPDELTLGVTGIAVLYLVYELMLTHDTRHIIREAVAGISVAFFFFMLWYVSKGRWLGFGDVKLSLPLGIIVGATGAFSMVVFSFWVGAAISLLLLALQRAIGTGKTSLRFLQYPLTIKSEVPFAPFLILGFLIVHLFHANIFAVTFFLMGQG